MKNLSKLTACLPLLAICLSVPSASAQSSAAATARLEERHEPEFSDTTLNDRYGFHVLALRLTGSDVSTGGSRPFAISGYYHFHGDGTLDGRDHVSSGISGTPLVVERVYTGTYHVDADGTGSLILNMSPTFHPEGHFVITNSGKSIEIIFDFATNMNTFTLYKQHTIGSNEFDHAR